MVPAMNLTYNYIDIQKYRNVYIYCFTKYLIMADVVPVPRPIPTIRCTGIIDYDGLYNLIISWFKDNLYDFIEEKHELKPTQGGKEIKLQWAADKKVTSYLKYVIKIYMILIDVNKVEIVEQGVKKKRVKARVEIKIKAHAELDYQARWEKTKFQKMLRDLYHKYVIKYYIMFDVWLTLYNKIEGLSTKIKKFLNMSSV